MYMAPEIVTLQKYDTKVDIWSVGIITHILLSGAVPFYGKSKIDIYKSIVRDRPKFGRFKDNLTPAAIGFTMLMLEKDPKKRMTAA